MFLFDNSGKFYKILFSFSIIFWYQKCLEHKSWLINLSDVRVSDSGSVCESIDLIFVELFSVKSSFKGFKFIRLNLDFFISDNICCLFQLKIEDMNANELFVVGVVFENSLKIFDLTDNFKVAINRIDGL